jgi:hypothetical protein
MLSARKVVSSSSRSLSSVAAESPRLTLAKNVLRFSAVARANNEAALDAAVKAQVKVDTLNLPAEIAGLDRYLNLGGGAAAAKFAKDPAAWQNLALEDKFVREATRTEAWPFMAGGM